MAKELNPTEAVFGFAAWLTGRHEVLKIGGSEDCGSIAELILEFVEANNLGEVSSDWPNNLVMPCTE